MSMSPSHRKRRVPGAARAGLWTAVVSTAVWLAAAERLAAARHHRSGDGGAAQKGAPSDTPAARAAEPLLAQGQAALAAGDYQAAQTALTAAYRKSPGPEILFALGKVAAAQGRGVAARDLLRRYLQESSGDSESPNQKEAQQLSEKAIEASGEVEVLGARGALVFVDELLVGGLPLPLPLLLPLGSHRVAVVLGEQRVEEQIKTLSGQTAQMRFNQRTAVVVVSLPPAIVLLPEGSADAAAHKRVAQALQQAAAKEKQAVVTREQAVAQAPKLAGCLDTLSCQLELLSQNEAPYALRVHLRDRCAASPAAVNGARGEGRAEPPANNPCPVNTAGVRDVRGGAKGEPPGATEKAAGSWLLELQLIDSSAGAVAATATPSCGECTIEQAAAAAAAALGPLLQQAAGRGRGSVELNSQPSAAEVYLAGERVGVTPYRGSRFVGSYPLVLRKEGYSPYQTSLAVAAGQTASVNAVLLAAAAGEPEPAPAELEKTPSPPLPPPRRPLWRLVTGVLLIGGGATVAGFGIGALAINGECDLEGAPGNCVARYNTLVPGALLVGGGALLIAGGIALAAVPAPQRKVQVLLLPLRGGGGLGAGGLF